MVLTIAIIAGAFFLLSVIAYMVLATKNSTDTYSEMGKLVGKNSLRRLMARMYQKIYIRMMKTPGMRRYLWKLRKRLEYINAYDEYTLRKESAKISLLTMGITVGFIVVLLCIYQSFFYVLWVLLGALILHNMLMDVFVNMLGGKLLKQQPDLLSDIRHFYQQHQMVDEALYEAAQVAKYDVSLHANRTHDVLTSEVPSEELDKYYDVAPNRYFKVFASISHLIMEYGDKIVRQGSLYLQALSKIGNEINMEVLRREKLSWQLRGLVVIALIPLLFLQPIEAWSVKYFPQMASFYDGKLGFIIKIIVFVIVTISYLLLRRLQEHDDQTLAHGSNDKKVWKWMYETRLGTAIVERTISLRSSGKYFRMTRLLKDTNSSLTPEWFHIKRITLSAVCFIFVIGIFVGVHITARQNILYSPTSLDLSLGQPSKSDFVVSQQLTDLDRTSIKKLHGQELTKEEIIRDLQAEDPTMQPSDIILTADRLEKKLQAYNTEYFKWWEFLIALTVGVLGYYGPHWILLFYRRIREMEMQTEVDQFHTLLSILSRFDRMSVAFILEQLERFAVIFKEPLQTCLLNYDSGAEEALTKLKEDVSFVPFRRIVEKLLLSVERVPIEEAFDDLDMEIEYYTEKRKQNQEKVVQQKSGWGFMIGFAPVYALIFLYLVFPLIYTSIEQMTAYAEQLKQFK